MIRQMVLNMNLHPYDFYQWPVLMTHCLMLIVGQVRVCLSVKAEPKHGHQSLSHLSESAVLEILVKVRGR